MRLASLALFLIHKKQPNTGCLWEVKRSSLGRIPNRPNWIYTKLPLYQSLEALWDDALLLVFLMPDRPLGSVHHFVSTYNAIIAQAQEIAEKMNAAGFPGK